MECRRGDGRRRNGRRGRIMSLESMIDMAGGLMAITAFNAVIAFGITFIYLIIRDKLRATKLKQAKKRRVR